MKRIKPCVSFDTAKKLKDAAYPEDGAFWYWQHDDHGTQVCVGWQSAYKDMEKIAAPTALEIMVTLEKHSPTIQFTGTFFDCLVHTDGSDISAWDLNPHEAAAKLWIELNEK